MGNGDFPQRHYPVAVVQDNDGAAQGIAVWKWPNARERLARYDVP